MFNWNVFVANDTFGDSEVEAMKML